MRLRRYRYIIPMAFLLFTCLEEDPVNRAFPVVDTGDVSNVSTAGARFSGTLAYRKLDEIIDHGFVWGTQEELSLEASFFASLGTPAQAEFSADINSTLMARATYYCRSFARTKEKTVYGNLVKFSSLGSEGPLITSFAPLQGSSGDTLKVSGRNFSHRKEVNIVTFEGVPAVVAEATDTLLKVIVPPEPAKVSNKIKVSILDHISESNGSFNIKAPRILSVVKSTFMLCDTVVISGEGLMVFGHKPSVRLNGLDANIVDVSPTQIRFTSQWLMPGAVNLSISGKLFNITSPVQLTQIQPEITSIDPPVYLPGDTITISGRNWPSCKPLTVTMHNAYIFISNLQPVKKKDNQLSFVVPANTCIAAAKLAVAGQSFSFTTDKTLQYKLPKITSIEPSHGKVNDIVVITGENLEERSYESVNFLTRISSSKTEYRGKVKDLSVSSPAIDVEVLNCGGPSKVTHGFTYDPPEIISFTPKVITGWDDVITIEGKNFSPADNKITINDVPINYPLPASATGDRITIRASFIIVNSQVSKKTSGKIKITTRTGQHVTSSDDLTIDYQGIWTSVGNFPDGERILPLSLSINGKGYMGFGHQSYLTLYKDWWEFNPASGTWTRKSDFPGEAKLNYVAATANGKAYVGLGDLRTSWWQYDPATDQWESKADFPGPGRYNNFIFDLNGKIYVGGGLVGPAPNPKDLWEYDPALDTWTEKKSLPWEPSPQTLAFGFKGKGYLYSYNTSGQPVEFEYDPAADAWTTRIVSTMFFSNPKWSVFKFDDYVILYGAEAASSNVYFYKVVPGSNATVSLTWYGTRRYAPVSFSLGGKGYIGMGYERATSRYLLDFWTFDPQKLK